MKHKKYHTVGIILKSNGIMVELVAKSIPWTCWLGTGTSFNRIGLFFVKQSLHFVFTFIQI